MSQDHLRPYLELEGICPDPVFIIGSPRSGTTILGHALDQHPELWASKESYVLHQLYGLGRARSTWKHHWERTNPSWLRTEQVERGEFLGFLGLGVNAMYSSRSEGRRWVDPTPLNTPMVGDLAEIFPGASFIHVMRDGRFVVRSMGSFLKMMEGQQGPIPDDEVPEWTGDFRQACETWAEYVEIACTFERANPERCLTVRNDDLSADPDAGFARIQDFLRIVADEHPAAFFARTRINSSFQDGPIPDDAGMSEWSPAMRRQFAQIAGPTMLRAGYMSADDLSSWAASGAGVSRSS